MYEELTNTDRNTNWKSLPAFCPFCESIRNLLPNDQEEQEKKVCIILKLALKQLQKHFNVWINKLLFLSLYPERLTYQCITSYLLSEVENLDPSIQASYESSIYCRVVNLVKFQNFLLIHCTSRNSCISPAHAHPHLTAID